MKRTVQIVLTLVLLLGLCACGAKESTPTWQEQYDLGVRYLEDGDYEEAIIAFTAAIEIDPKRAEAYVGRGDAYVLSGDSRGNLRAARADYEKALELDETLAAAYLGLVDVYIRQEKFEKAADILRQGADLAEDREELLEKIKQMDEVVEDIRFDWGESNGFEYAVITGVNAAGAVQWTYTTGQYEMTELGQVEEIGLNNGRYYFVEGGAVVALNPNSGEVMWKNDDFGGAGTCFAFYGSDLLLAGYYGPDFFWLDEDGNTVRRIEHIDPRYIWPSEIRVEGGYAKITMEGIPDGYGEYILQVSLDRNAVVDDTAWREAYLDYIENSWVDEWSKFQLIYVDNDDIPELWVCYGNIAAGAQVCTFDGSQVDEIYISEYGFLQYIERGNLFYTSGGHSDIYWDGVFKIQNGRFVEVAHGDFGAEDNANVQYDENQEPIYQYSWNGRDVSEQEYQEHLARAFDSSRARDVFKDPTYDYYEIQQVLLG